jgi:predicted lipoprotein with Yx(FWY)xxD motif
MRSHIVKRLLPPGAALAVSLALAACGGGSGGSSSSATTTTGGATTTVSVRSIDGIGDVLVDSAGKALYASDLEAGGKVMCTGGCTSFWKPLTVGAAMPKAAGDVGKLGVATRPDGSKQVTVDGRLLYTFSQDQPGKVNGNGFADEFDGRHFTWSAVLAGGGTARSSGGGSSTAPSRNDYGY